jgi:hypothetical protein
MRRFGSQIAASFVIALLPILEITTDEAYTVYYPMHDT